MTRYWHRVQSLKEVGTYLVSRGVRPADVLRANNLPEALLLDSGAWIERTLCFGLIEDISRRTHDPYLGLHLAEFQRLADYGHWGEGILRSPTLRHALDFASSRIGLIRTGVSVVVHIENDRVRLSASFSGISDEGSLHPSLACMMTLYRIVRLVNEPIPIEVRMCLPGRRDTDEAERLVGPRLAFGAERNEVVFDRRALELPLRPLTVAEKDAFGLLRTGQPLATAQEAHRRMRELLGSGRTRIVDVASALHMSVRQLQRHLDQWGTTYEQMLDEYRQMSALSQLSGSELSVTEIAFRLGYSDTSHFTRAVRRWTGNSPRQVRLEPVHSRGLLEDPAADTLPVYDAGLLADQREYDHGQQRRSFCDSRR